MVRALTGKNIMINKIEGICMNSLLNYENNLTFKKWDKNHYNYHYRENQVHAFQKKMPKVLKCLFYKSCSSFFAGQILFLFTLSKIPTNNMNGFNTNLT